MKPAQPQGRAGKASFRMKLTVALMLVVVVATGLAVYFVQHSARVAFQQNLQTEFQNRTAYLFDAQDARQRAVAERCRALARSVRMRAALEDDDVDDLFKVASSELHDVMGDGKPVESRNAATMLHASFFCFLTAKGEILSAPGDTGVGAWEKQILEAGTGPGSQQTGFVAAKMAGGKTEITEIVTTPVIGPDGAVLGALVLGFPPVESESGADVRTGLWVDGELHMPGMPPADRESLSRAISADVGQEHPASGNVPATAGGQPQLLFYKILNPGSRFRPAYAVCAYSVADWMRRQEMLQWKIIGGGLLVLLLGFAASHLFSVTIAKPVEQLAEDSEKNLELREQAESALEITEQKYRSIFENAVEGIFLLAPDGKYLSANPAMARIFGYESPAAFIAAVDDPRKLYASPHAHAQFLKLAETNGFVSDFETQMLRKDGSTIWVSQNARKVRDTADGPVHFEGTLEDISERKEAVDALHSVNAELEKALGDLKATQQQVIQQERLRALGQMASGIAHDFNNALMPVSGFAELLTANPAILDDKPKATGYIQIIRTAAQDAANIVARLREFYRANEHSDVFTEINLARLVRQTITLTQPKWKNQAQANGAEIHVEDDLGDVPPIAGDESALREVLTNLIFNAVDAMPGGGTLRLKTFTHEGRAMVTVSDTGVGMSEAVRERCMEPFFSTKGERGTGLGLSMVFGIVQRHEGKIDLKSRAGEGTTFSISFPARTVAAGKAQGADGACHGALRVLVVDDEPQVRQVMTAFLNNDGHQVQTADDGVDGLRRFLDGKFDLVITDKAMPGMSGDQMAAAIKQLSPRMPIVLLSGFHVQKENETLEGIDVVASKPISLTMLRETINKAMKAA